VGPADAAASFPRIIDWYFPAKMMDRDIDYRDINWWNLRLFCRFSDNLRLLRLPIQIQLSL
jgi:hypothetical protein